MSERVKIDAVMVDTGLTPGIEIDEQALPEIAERLEQSATDFLLAGGQVTWTEWSRFSNPTRHAFTRAGQRLRDEMAGNLAAAIHDLDVAESLVTGQDVTEVKNERAVAEAAEAAVEESHARATG